MKQKPSNKNTPATKSKANAAVGDKASVKAEMKNRAGSTSDAASENNAAGKDKNKMEKGKAPLEKFFCDMLMDIYYAENKLLTAIPKMEEAATTDELKEAFNDHLHQTQKHVKRLEKVFTLIGKKAEGKKCEAIEGITKEADSIIEETEEGTMTRDAALIIAAQKVEHYEIATYGGLVQLALTMNLKEAAEILDTTLMEEEDTDHRLTEIAESHINMDAEHEAANYSWTKEDSGKRQS
jgi:ferritin-like metal-binding protein YciE